MSAPAPISTLPIDPAEFDKDDRISFSKLDSKHIAVQDDGTEFEFDNGLKRWIPLADESDDALIEEYQKNYGGADGDSWESQPAQSKKRKIDQSNDREDGNGRSNSKRQTRQPPKQPQPKQNRAVYVAGLPLDVTVDEVAELFSRKCGVIAEEIDSGRPRIKLYTDPQGNFKGDALIVFFKPQSVDMAIMLLDDTDFRITPSGLGTGKMRVQAADLSFKKTNQDGNKEGDANDGASGSSAHQDKARGNNKRNDDKAKVIKKTQKLDARLADWDDDEPPAALSALIPSAKGGKWDKVVILSHMFTLDELEEDPAALLEIKEDIREECSKLGEVTNVVLYDQEEDGIVSVRFKDVESAQACVHTMHGRSFAGRTVEAFFATGKEKFRKSKKDQGEDDDEDP